MSNIILQSFSDIDINSSFFNTLKEDYPGFVNWFNKKANDGQQALTLYTENQLDAFLYLKIETEEINDVTPQMPAADRLKVGTFKVNAHGTRLGERFIKKIFDTASENEITQIYVTIFPKHEGLLDLFKSFGFYQYGQKGKELVFVKDFNRITNNIIHDYPIIHNNPETNKYCLSIYPQFHSRLFPDSLLNNEDFNILSDVSHTNSIHKIYICGMSGVTNFNTGDIVLIYRTGDGAAPARYRSVITSICVVEEVKNMNEFNNIDDYLAYCEPYSIFSHDELNQYYKERRYPYIIKMTYNVAFTRRVTNGDLIDNHGVNPNYWGVFQISETQFQSIITSGRVNESLIVN